jgi:hypothetical protein
VHARRQGDHHLRWVTRVGRDVRILPLRIVAPPCCQQSPRRQQKHRQPHAAGRWHQPPAHLPCRFWYSQFLSASPGSAFVRTQVTDACSLSLYADTTTCPPLSKLVLKLSRTVDPVTLQPEMTGPTYGTSWCPYTRDQAAVANRSPIGRLTRGCMVTPIEGVTGSPAPVYAPCGRSQPRCARLQRASTGLPVLRQHIGPCQQPSAHGSARS